MTINIQEAIKRLKTPGTRFSGSDWKYGWPHKFYVGDDKVYNYEVKELSESDLAEWSHLTEKFFGVHFIRDEKGIKWMCPYPGGFYGYQRSGVVGEDGEPKRNDEWNPDFQKSHLDNGSGAVQ